MDASIDPSFNEKNTPHIVIFHNSKKVGIDLVDQLCRNYDVSGTMRRWSMVLFLDLPNTKGKNAVCSYNSHHLN